MGKKKKKKTKTWTYVSVSQGDLKVEGQEVPT